MSFFCRAGDNSWMQCTLNIATELVANGRPIPYKYLIKSPSFVEAYSKKAKPFEYLQGCPRLSDIPNRCLEVPTNCGKYRVRKKALAFYSSLCVGILQWLEIGDVPFKSLLCPVFFFFA